MELFLGTGNTVALSSIYVRVILYMEDIYSVSKQKETHV